MLDFVTCASMFVASMYDEKGDLVIPGPGGTLEMDVEWSRGGFQATVGLLEGIELVSTGGLTARVWTRPSVPVIGFDAYPASEVSNTIVPYTHFRLSMHVIPDVGPYEAMDHLVESPEFHTPFGVKVEVAPSELGPGYQVGMSSVLTGLLHEVLGEARDVPSVNTDVGDSIPFISDFRRLFPDTEVVVTDVEDLSTSAHSEGEPWCISNFHAAVLTGAMSLTRLASQ